MPDLSGWSNFYVITGSAAAALIGLQFVAMTLIASMPVLRAPEAGAAFATPTIIHFGVVLLLSALASIPWHDSLSASIAWGVVGVCGLAYSAVVTRRLRNQTAYEPVLEDWLFHAVLPLVAYAILGGSAFEINRHTSAALFGIAAATLLFLLIGIHNAWDAVTYHVFKVEQSDKREQTEDWKEEQG